jgi:hypothetical protein
MRNVQGGKVLWEDPCRYCEIFRLTQCVVPCQANFPYSIQVPTTNSNFNSIPLFVASRSSAWIPPGSMDQGGMHAKLAVSTKLDSDGSPSLEWFRYLPALAQSCLRVFVFLPANWVHRITSLARRHNDT